MGQKEKALLDFSKAIELNPKDSNQYVLRGYLYQRMGQQEKALLDFNKAIELDPKYSVAFKSRAFLY